MKKFFAEDLNGVMPAMITSFNKDENINKEGIRKTVNYLVSQNVHGLYITGSTGETFLMSPDEKKEVIDIIVEEVNGRVPVIAHIGSIGTKITIELGQHAEKSGVDALSALPPFYYGFSNNEIYNYYNDISNSSNLPIIVYNISQANLIDLDTLKKLASIKNIKGVKYTSPTHFNFSKIKKEISKDEAEKILKDAHKNEHNHPSENKSVKTKATTSKTEAKAKKTSTKTTKTKKVSKK